MSQSAVVVTPDDINLMLEAKQLARPAIFLREEPRGEVAALWGGEGTVPLPPELVVTDENEIEDGLYYHHWLSVNARFLPPELGLQGVISVYWHDDQEEGLVLNNPQGKLSATAEQISLYAYAGESLPFIDAVFMQGSPKLQEWLVNGAKWQLREQYNDNFYNRLADDAMKAQIDELYAWHSEHNPIWAANADVQIGGWPWSWPDGLWNEHEDRGQRLVLWTFRGSEPWLEVWWKEGEFEVVARIT